MKLVKRRGCILFLLILLSLLFVFQQPPVFCDETVTVKGVVREQSTGNPVPHAKILVFRVYFTQLKEAIIIERYPEKVADSSGHFILELPKEKSYIIYAYCDDSLTPGFDYVPAMEIIKEAGGDYNLTFELWNGASLFLEGEAFLVEMTGIPEIYSCSVLDPESGKVLHLGGYSLYYEEGSSHSSLLGNSLNHIIVPSGIHFMVEVSCKVTVEADYYKLILWERELKLSFLIDEPGHFLLEKGEAFHVNMGAYSLSSSLSRVREEASEISLSIEESEEVGFYLVVERQRFAKITSLILEAEDLLGHGAYEASFTKLRGAYVEISNLRDWLNSMYTEALRSVFLLILFLAFTATAVSFLLFEEKAHKAIGSSGFYVVFLLGLYLLYPGSRLVEASLFLTVSIVSLLAVFGLTTLLPRYLKGRAVRGRVPLRNMVVPVFSIAKRNLRRRRLRSSLTLTSVMILVSGFIALTSFTTGFGLTFGRVSRRQSPTGGILVRAPKLLEKIPQSQETIGLISLDWEELFWFLPLDDSSIGWFESRPETSLVAPKYENLPRIQYRRDPLAYLKSLGHASAPIYGVIGFTPSAEAEVLRLNETVIEGSYLGDGDENGVLISAKLGEKLNATVGETLTFSGPGKILELKVIGVFDDKRVENLRDLDGDSLLPRKIVDINPRVEGEEDHIIIEGVVPCLANETLMTTWRTASRIEGVWLSRLDIVLEDEDLKDYAKKMALNKGFRVWASTEEGIYLAQLGSYFEGKGLPLTVPWLIVVLNVVVTMLNSLYERKRDIYIYSSIGMSPSHISGLFLAEAVVIGVLGGGIGYLLGLGWYKAMSLLTLTPQVRQKISAIWSLAAIAVSLAAVLVGGLLALRWSVVITPSLKRKWRIEKRPVTPMEPLELTLPVTVTEGEVEGFIEYVMKALRSYIDGPEFYTWEIIGECVEETEGASIRRTEFVHRPSILKLIGIYPLNKVVLRRERGSEVYEVKLLIDGSVDRVQRVGSSIRKIIIGWSVERGKLEGGR